MFEPAPTQVSRESVHTGLSTSQTTQADYIQAESLDIPDAGVGFHVYPSGNVQIGAGRDAGDALPDVLTVESTSLFNDDVTIQASLYTVDLKTSSNTFAFFLAG